MSRARPRPTPWRCWPPAALRMHARCSLAAKRSRMLLETCDLPHSGLLRRLERRQGKRKAGAQCRPRQWRGCGACGERGRRPARSVVPPKTSTYSDYLFLKLGQAGNRPDIAAKASPELLFLLARDDEAGAELRLAAAERAASLNIIDGEALAAVYRDAAQRLPKSTQRQQRYGRSCLLR